MTTTDQTPALAGGTEQLNTPEAGPGDVETHASEAGGRARGLRMLWNGICAGFGAVLGLLPHVAHHAGLLLGAAAVTGLAGNLALAALGVLLSVPLLRRLYRRFGTWRAPAIALGLFLTMYAVSALVIGPAITGASKPAGDQTPPGNFQVITPPPGTGQPNPDHLAHHANG